MHAAAQPKTFYASHVYHPFFLHGTKTYALELWEQLGGRLPAVLVLPVGNGTLVLVAYLACRELLAQGLISQLAAVCWAALRARIIDIGPASGDQPRAVAPLCGIGLKSKLPT